MEKRKSRIFLIQSLVICGCFFLYLLITGREEYYDKNARRFAAIICTGGYYWEDIQAGIQAADLELGTATEYMQYQKFDTGQQLELLEQAQYMKVDGIITIGEPNSGEIDAKIAQLQEKGIPVVLIDADSKKSGRECYIGTDNYEAGKMAGDKLSAAMDGKADILVVLSKLDAR